MSACWSSLAADGFGQSIASLESVLTAASHRSGPPLVPVV